jgi:thioredoxin-related protein
MKRIITLSMAILLVAGTGFLQAQETEAPKKIYNPEANAREDIGKAVQQAHADGKHVFVQIGGNWCPWCLRFHAFINDDPDIKALLDDNYVFVLLNYSKENKNTDLLKEYDNPGRMGYPVFLILDGKGKLIHTQDSGLLEEGKGYNKNKVMTFLKNWTVAAVDPANVR